MEIGEFESEGDVKFLEEMRESQPISTKNETLLAGEMILLI